MLALFVVLGACSRLQVASDWDPGVDFSTIKSYILLPNDNGAVRPFAAQHIQEADVAVGWELATEDRTTYNTIHSGFGTSGFRQSRAHWGISTSTSRTTQQTYTIGTLLIAVYEMDNKELVWEGTATGNINASSGQDEEKINGAVQGILRDFPPGL